jgi:hypothetical protein
MKKLLFVLILVFTFCVAAFAQEKLSCPKIKVIGPDGIVPFGETVIFTAVITPNSDKYFYNWSVSGGKIQGQNTPVIKIETVGSGLDNKNIKATVTITGLPDNCPNSASELVSITADETWAFPLDTYPKISLRAEKSRLDKIAAELKNEGQIIFIFAVVFTADDDIDAVENRILSISRYLTEKHKIPKNKFNFIFGESNFYETAIHAFHLEKAKKFPRWQEAIKEMKLRRVQQSNQPQNENSTIVF